MKRWICLLALLTSFLAACSVDNQPVQLESLAYPPTLVTLKGLVPPHPLLYGVVQSTEHNPNCPVNEFNMPPQGYRVNGSAGGLSYEPLTAFKTPFVVGQGVRADFFVAPPPTSDASILIADDFGKNTLLQPGVFGLGPDVFTREKLDATALQHLQASGQLSHGALVFTHLQHVINGTGLYTLEAAASTASKKVYKRKGTTKLLTVVAVNTQLKNTQVITSKIITALDNLGSAKGRATVINMSFGLIPCKVYEDYKKWEASVPDVQTFEDYMIDLAHFNGIADYNTLVKQVIESTNLPDDPLFRMISGQFGVNYGTQKNIYVGAAGNYSLDYSMYPANWDKVVNVTGSSFDNPSKRDTSFFSQGEVMHVGASLKLEPPKNLLSGKPLYYIGTSFSTPTVVAYSALDVAMTQRCAEFGMNPVSELAKNLPQLIDVPLEDGNGVSGAVSRRCGAS